MESLHFFSLIVTMFLVEWKGLPASAFVGVFTYLFYCLDKTAQFHAQLSFEMFAEGTVRNDPPVVNFDRFTCRASWKWSRISYMMWLASPVQRITIGIGLYCRNTFSWIALCAFYFRHTWGSKISSATGTMSHLCSNKFKVLWVSNRIGPFCTDEGVNRMCIQFFMKPYKGVWMW